MLSACTCEESQAILTGAAPLLSPCFAVMPSVSREGRPQPEVGLGAPQKVEAVEDLSAQAVWEVEAVVVAAGNSHNRTCDEPLSC